MAKKKKRRLKKSVKIGCTFIIALLALGIISTVHFCTMDRHHNEPRQQETDNEHRAGQSSTLINPEIKERIEKLIHSPQRLDSNKIAISIYDLTAGAPVIQWHDHKLMPPASCMKVLTAVTALKRLGVNHQYCESVAIHGEINNGTLYGTVLMTLDDDPLCESLTPLADALRQHGIQRIEGDLVLDLLRNDTLRAHPSAASWDIPYHKVPLLLKGRPRIERDLLYTLHSRGITFHHNLLFADPTLAGVDREKEPVAWQLAVNAIAKKAHTLHTQQTPLTDVITPMMIHSSNIKADALFYHMNHAYDRFAGRSGVQKPLMQSFIEENLQYPESQREGFVINDGSGLSPHNRLNADFLLQLLVYAWRHDEIRRVFIDQAMATPGERRGSLLGRMSAPMFRGKIFCKTGTLTTIGASSLCGYAEAQDGHWYAFSIINEDSPVAESRIYQDKVCKELVR